MELSTQNNKINKQIFKNKIVRSPPKSVLTKTHVIKHHYSLFSYSICKRKHLKISKKYGLKTTFKSNNDMRRSGSGKI